jgi:hypothetical protein
MVKMTTLWQKQILQRQKRVLHSEAIFEKYDHNDYGLKKKFHSLRKGC